MKQQIVSRWDSSKVLFECDVPDDLPSGLRMRHALEKAVADLTGADLTDADLTGANLTGADFTRAVLTRADLTGANLTDADLTGADLTRADLTRAVLTRANLTRADLTRAVLTRADFTRADFTRAVLTGADFTRAVFTRAVLTGADLTRANLTDADFTRAVLTRADLTGANLTDADLTGADLTSQKADFFDILLRASREVAGLRAALIAGKVDGSTYEGECACLVGTIANVRSASFHDLGNGIKPNSSRPAERWFLGIREGDTPDTNQISAITVGWIDEFVVLLELAKL